MLKFEQELEKFKPILEIDKIENKIATEDMRDIIDLIKTELPEKGVKHAEKNDDVDKEL